MQYVQYKLLKMMMIIEYSEQKLVNKTASTKTDSPEQTTATQKRLFENTPRTKKPRDGNDNPGCSAELRQRTELCPRLIIGCRRLGSYSSDHCQRLLLAVTKSADQKQQIFLLIDQRLAEALRSQVFAVQAFYLRTQYTHVPNTLHHLEK